MSAELICKAVQQILADGLAEAIQEESDRWKEEQKFDSLTIPPDDMGIPIVLRGDIIIGDVEVVSVESNFPAIYIWVEEEHTEVEGEQLFTGNSLQLCIRVIANGLTVEGTQKTVYRYTNAIRRLMGKFEKLGGTVDHIRLARIRYASSPDDPLFKACQLEYTVSFLEQYG